MTNFQVKAQSFSFILPVLHENDVVCVCGGGKCNVLKMDVRARVRSVSTHVHFSTSQLNCCRLHVELFQNGD